MNFGIKRSISGIFSSVSQTQYVPVRYRYHAEKIARGPTVRKYGYKEKIFREGLLPRLENVNKLPIPDYKPANAWAPKKALFGQNDYIDILGGGKVKPIDVCYDVPKWLRGRKGNELQLLLLKQKIFSNTRYEQEFPTAWYNMSKRIKYLYKFLNKKTKTGLSKD